MGLSCGYDGGDYDWWYEAPEDFEVLATKRSRRCFSCKCKIKVGDTCARFENHRSARHDIEERIYGDTVPMPDTFLCEGCGGLFFALEELGYDISFDGSSMRELVEQHNEIQREERKWQDRYGDRPGVCA